MQKTRGEELLPRCKEGKYFFFTTVCGRSGKSYFLYMKNQAVGVSSNTGFRRPEERKYFLHIKDQSGGIYSIA